MSVFKRPRRRRRHGQADKAGLASIAAAIGSQQLGYAYHRPDSWVDRRGAVRAPSSNEQRHRNSSGTGIDILIFALKIYPD